MECRVVHHLELRDLDGSAFGQHLVIGQVVGVHLDEAAIVGGVVDSGALRPDRALRRPGRLHDRRADLQDGPADELSAGAARFTGRSP